MSIAIYGLAVQTIGIGIAFLIGAVVCQEFGRILRRRPIPQNYSALSGLLFVTAICGAEIGVVFVISAIAAPSTGTRLQRRKLSPEATLLGGLIGLLLIGSLALFVFPSHSPLTGPQLGQWRRLGSGSAFSRPNP